MKGNDRLQWGCFMACLLIAGNFSAQGASAADADNGRRIAQMRCTPCHVVEPKQRRELENSPPFDVIARKNDFNAEMLAYLILDPHPRMNMTLTESEVDDLAAYIISLRQ
jgi:mono/diheme cytochrome c family protein